MGFDNVGQRGAAGLMTIRDHSSVCPMSPMSYLSYKTHRIANEDSGFWAESNVGTSVGMEWR